MYAFALVMLALAQPAVVQPVSEPLVGIVVGSDGKPLGDVDVLLSIGLPPSGERPLIGGVLWRANGPKPLRERRDVLARSRTGPDGRFRIELPAEIVRSQEPLPVVLWAVGPDGLVAARRLPWAIPAPSEQLTLMIVKGAPAVFRVLGPDGVPDAGARIEVVALEGMIVPQELAQKIGAATSRDGSVTIKAVGREAIRRVSVESSKYGKQLIGEPAAESAIAGELQLASVGRVSIRIFDDAGKPVNGLRVHAQTFPDGYGLGGTAGLGEGETDSQGRLEIPAIAAGRLALVLDLRARPELPYRGLPPANQVVEAGQTTTVEIRLKLAAHLKGLIRERGTGLPIAGVSPEIPDLAVRAGENARVVTNARGEFEGFIEGQQPYAFLYTTPKPYFIPADAPDALQLLPAGATEFKLPPKELVRGVTLSGSVVDETGKMVSGALVRASWGGTDSVLQSVAVRTDSSGRFLLEGLDPLADLRLIAESPGRFSGAPLTTRADSAKQIKLVVSQTNTVTLAGRVVDSSGKPIENAAVRIRSQTRHTQGQVWRIDPVSFGEQSSVFADKSGVPHMFSIGDAAPCTQTRTATSRPRTRSLRGLNTRRPRRNETPLPAGQSGSKPAAARPLSLPMSSWIASCQWKAWFTTETASPSRARPCSNPVMDRFARETLTDANGRFHLPGVISGKAIVFVKKDGFRFHGQTIDTRASQPPDLVLNRVDEAGAALKTLESALPHPEELAIARRLLAPYIERVQASGSDPQKFQALIALAPVDPARTLELLDSQGAGKPRIALDFLRSAVAVAIAAQSPEEGVTLAESIQDDGARTWCLIDLFDKLPASARARKTELLARALLQAKSASNPVSVCASSGALPSDGLIWVIKSGLSRSSARGVRSPRRSRRRLTSSRCLPRSLLASTCPPRSPWSKTARPSPSAATASTASLSSIEPTARSPTGSLRPTLQAAERVLNLIVDRFRRGGYVVAACTRMAPKDPAVRPEDRRNHRRPGDSRLCPGANGALACFPRSPGSVYPCSRSLRSARSSA